MDEPKHAMGGKPDMVGLRPFGIGTAVGYVGGEHRPEIGHLLAALALGEAFGIDSALLCLRIEKLTPGVQVNDQQASEHGFLVTAEPTLGTFVLPGGGAAAATHGEPLQRAVSACPGQPGVWEEVWRGL